MGKESINKLELSPEIKKKLRPPSDLKRQLRAEDKAMDSFLIDNNISYEGTPLYEDSIEIFRINKKEELLADDDDDPFEVFGHGAMSYFRMIQNMICVMFVCTILFTPVMFMYYQGGAYEKDGIFLN